MTALTITVPFTEGETTASLGSRLAQANGRERFRDFALDVGLDFQAVVDGRTHAVDHLASLAGCPPSKLASWAAVAGADRTVLRGQDLGWRSLRRSRVFVCPSCLRADFENETLDWEVRPWGRAVWQIPALRTCRIHDRSLVEIAHAEDAVDVHDFAALALFRASDLPDLEDASARRLPSALEDYIHGRLTDGRAGAEFLDALPLYAVMRLAENVGAVLRFGPKVRIERLDECDLHSTGSAGYEVISEGESGIRRALTKLQDAFHEGGYDWGPRALFGRLYEWLAHETDDAVYDPVRDIIERHVVETMPIGPGETVVNRKVTDRRIHSLHSASREYDLHPKRLRKILLQDGLIKPEDVGQSDERVLFPVEAIVDRLEALADAFSLKVAGEYLNAPRPHERLLLEAGYLKPFIVGGTDTLHKHAIARVDLDDFLIKLGAMASSDVTDGFSIPAAAKRANCTAMEIVGLLLERKLLRVGLDRASRGYLAVLVNVDEVKALVRHAEHGGLSLRLVEKKMNWSTKVVTTLIKGGHLPSSVAVNPVNRCPQRIVLEADLASFDSAFVTLNSLASERGVHFRRLKNQLAAVGVKPDLAFVDVPATFYKRVEVEAAIAVG